MQQRKGRPGAAEETTAGFLIALNLDDPLSAPVALKRVHGSWKFRGNQNGRPRARATALVPGRERLYRDMASLFRRDLANVEAGGPVETIISVRC